MADPVQDAAAAAGVRVSVTPEGERGHAFEHDRVLEHVGRTAWDPRWPHAKARLFRILEGAGQHGASSFAEGLKNATMPSLAREAMNLFVNYKFFRHRQSRWNPFLGLNDADAARKFIALVYGICDRSTGKLGHWYTR